MPVTTLVATPDPEPRRRRGGRSNVTRLAAWRTPRPGEQLWPGVKLTPGARVTGLDDGGEERFGTVSTLGCGIGDFRLGPSGQPPTYQSVPVVWDTSELVDVTRLTLLDPSDDPGPSW